VTHGPAGVVVALVRAVLRTVGLAGAARQGDALGLDVTRRPGARLREVDRADRAADPRLGDVGRQRDRQRVPESLTRRGHRRHRDLELLVERVDRQRLLLHDPRAVRIDVLELVADDEGDLLVGGGAAPTGGGFGRRLGPAPGGLRHTDRRHLRSLRRAESQLAAHLHAAGHEPRHEQRGRRRGPGLRDDPGEAEPRDDDEGHEQRDEDATAALRREASSRSVERASRCRHRGGDLGGLGGLLHHVSVVAASRPRDDAAERRERAQRGRLRGLVVTAQHQRHDVRHPHDDDDGEDDATGSSDHVQNGRSRSPSNVGAATCVVTEVTDVVARRRPPAGPGPDPARRRRAAGTAGGRPTARRCAGSGARDRRR